MHAVVSLQVNMYAICTKKAQLGCPFHLAAMQLLIGGVTCLLELENMFVLMFSNQKQVFKYSTRSGARALMKTSALRRWTYMFC